MTILNQLMSFLGCLWNSVVDLDFLMFACMNLIGEGGREGGREGARGRDREERVGEGGREGGGREEERGGRERG